MTPFEKRQSVVEQRKTQAQAQLISLASNLEAFNRCITQLNRSDIHEHPEDLVMSVNTAFAVLNTLPANAKAAFVTVCQDDLLKKLLSTHSVTSENGHMLLRHKNVITKILELGLSSIQGLVHTQQLTIKTADAQLEHLNEQMIAQVNVNRTIFDDYIKKSSHRYVKAHFSVAHGIMNSGEAYDAELSAYIDHEMADIIKRVKPHEDIDAQVQLLVAEKAEKFEQEYLDDYLQFEAIKMAVADLESYISVQRSVKERLFESEASLSRKIMWAQKLSRLSTLKENTTKDVRQCVNDVKTEVKRPIFRQDMTNLNHHDENVFNWLVRWVVSLLESLHLYKPAHKAVYEAFLKSVEQTENERSSRRDRMPNAQGETPSPTARTSSFMPSISITSSWRLFNRTSNASDVQPSNVDESLGSSPSAQKK
jgi:hypothetical protein